VGPDKHGLSISNLLKSTGKQGDLGVVYAPSKIAVLRHVFRYALSNINVNVCTSRIGTAYTRHGSTSIRGCIVVFICTMHGANLLFRLEPHAQSQGQPVAPPMRE